MTDVATLRVLVDIDSAGAAAGAARTVGAVRGMEAGLSGAFNRIKVAARGLSSEFDGVAGRSERFSSTLGRAFGGLSVGQKALIGVGSAAVLMGTALAASIGPAIRFESAFAGVEKTVDGTPEQLRRIRDGLLDLSAAIPTAAEDLADIAANAGQLGVAAPDIVEFTRTIALLGETTDLSFENAAQSLARFLNVTGNSAPIERIGDVIVELGNNSATTESQIVNFASRLASAFTLAGATEDEILAVAAAFSSLDVQAEAGGSSLSRVITQIADAAKVGGRDLEIFAETAGVTTEQFAELARRSPVEAFIAFADGLGEVQAQGRSLTPILKGLELDGIRTSRVLQLSALASDQLKVSLGLAADQIENGGAAFEEANKRFETTASRLETLRNRINRVAIELGTPALGLFAQGADLAGDAIEELFRILQPLGREAAGVFSNLAEVAGVFFDVIGSPALQAFGAGLSGATTLASGFLSALSAAGPAGTALAGVLATLTLFPGALATAASTAAAFSTEVQTVGLRAASASAAMSGFKLALSVAPLALFSAALIGIGDAMQDAEEKGRSFAGALESQLSRAVEATDYESTIRSVNQLAEAQRLLFEEIDNDSVVVAGRRIRDFSGTVDVLLGYLPGLSSEVLENEAAFRALSDATNDVDYSTLEETIARWAANLGISKEAVFELAVEQGVLQDIVSKDPAIYLAAKDAVTSAAEATQELADRSTVLADKVLAGTATISDYAELLGITEEQLLRVAERLDIDAKVFDGDDVDKINEAVDAIEATVGQYDELAAQLGISSAEYERQISIIEDLAGAQSLLRKAIDGTLSSYELVGLQQRKVTEAQGAFNEAVASITDVDSLKLAAGALRTYSAEFAGSGVNAREAAAAQAEFASQVIEAGIAAGIGRDEVLELVGTLGLIDPVYLAQIAVEGEQALAATEEVEGELVELAGQIYRVEIDADGTPALVAVGAVSDAAREWSETEYKAFLEANGVPAEEATDAAKQRAREFADEDYTAQLQGDDEGIASTLEALRPRLSEFTDSQYVAFLEANGIEADTEIDETQSYAREYAEADYTAFLRANGAEADEETAARQEAARKYAEADYTAKLRAADESSGTIEDVETKADEWAREYRSTLKADDQATETVSGANAELRRFQSKSITITANYIGRSSGSFAPSAVPVNVRRHGGILASFEDGGIAGAGAPDVIRAGVVAPVDKADIYSAATPYRVFAEPATSWEAYIPGAGDRNRNRQIWERTGQLLGFMARGGIMPQVSAFQSGGIAGSAPRGPVGSSISISAPINIDLAQLPAGVDLPAVAAMFEARIREAFLDLGRQIANVP